MTTKRGEAAGRPTFYDVQEVADMFRMSRMTVYRAIACGELAAVRIRGRWLVPARVIEAMVAAAVGEHRVVDADHAVARQRQTEV